MHWYPIFVIFAPFLIIIAALVIVYCCHDLDGGFIKDPVICPDSETENVNQEIPLQPTLDQLVQPTSEHNLITEAPEPEFTQVTVQPEKLAPIDADFPLACSESYTPSPRTSESPDEPPESPYQHRNIIPYVSPYTPERRDSLYPKSAQQYRDKLLHYQGRHVSPYKTLEQPSSSRLVTSSVPRPQSVGPYHGTSAAAACPMSARISYPPQLYIRGLPYTTAIEEDYL